MKILYVMGGAGVCGGTRVVWAHCVELQKLGHTVVYGTLDGARSMTWLDGNVPVLPANELLHDEWDVVVATGYDTWPAVYCSFIGRKFGFVQMKESLFLPFPRPNIADRQFSLPIGPVITISDWLKEYLEKECGHENVTVIPNGVDTELFYPEPRLDLRHNPEYEHAALVIGHELNAAKNVSDAIYAIRNAGDFEIWHVTPIRMQGLEADKTYVNPPQDMLRHLYSTADVFVMSSRYEGRSCLPVEAMACCCPVVAMDHKGTEDLIGHARVVPGGDVNALVEAIEDVFASPKKTRRLVAAGYEYVHSELRWEDIGKQLEEIYQG